jgi:hypothetical protein
MSLPFQGNCWNNYVPNKFSVKDGSGKCDSSVGGNGGEAAAELGLTEIVILNVDSMSFTSHYIGV